MALFRSQARERFLIVCASVTRLCTFLALLCFASISTAGEIKELSVTEAGGEYSLKVVAVLDAPVDYVYNVITDYKHAYRISPTIVEVEILPSGSDEVVRVRHRSEHWVGPFLFEIEWVGDFIEADGHRHIKVITIPEFSSFKSGFASWKLRPQGEHTLVMHESSLTPKFFILPVIGDYIIKKHVVRESRTIFNRIECNALIAFKIDLGQEVEHLKKLLKEGKNCINPQDDGSHLSLETRD